jgi:primary-amine oxidase
MTAHKLVEIIRLPTGNDFTLNHDAAYVPHKAKEYHHDLQSQTPRQDLKPLIVQQPQGVSFSIDGYLIRWQKWRFRLGFNWREGMVLHDVTYDDRELFHRLSLSEMFVPYGDPRHPYSRKSVFDVGDIGAGVAANNLALGCDCLGVIKVRSFCNLSEFLITQVTSISHLWSAAQLVSPLRGLMLSACMRLMMVSDGNTPTLELE